MRRVLNRLLAGSAAALLVAGVVALPGAPAVAAASAPEIVASFVGLLSITPGATRIDPLYAWATGGQSAVVIDPVTTVGKLTMTIDTAEVKDLATVDAMDLGSDDQKVCPAAGTLITCTIDGPLRFGGRGTIVPLLAMRVTGREGATEGADGRLPISISADGGRAVSRPLRVTVGAGAGLAGFIDTKATAVAAGATVDTDLRVVNTGAETMHDVMLILLGWDRTLVDGKGFSNCEYGYLTTCSFEDDLAPGKTYELSSPMRRKIPADAAAGSQARAIGSWSTTSDYYDFQTGTAGEDGASGMIGIDGTGPAVHLQAIAEPAVKPSKLNQADPKLDNNVLLSEFEVTGGEKPDEAAVGATVTGVAGEKVAAKVGFVNHGPGTLYHWTFENTDVVTEVKVPAGLTVVKADERCVPAPEAAETDGPGDDFVCSTYAYRNAGWTKAKASTLYDFTFKVKSASAPGTVEINGDGLLSDGDMLDRSKSDNTAALKVELAGGLPVTGSHAAVIGGAGALLAAAGVFGVVLFRRRRVRFTA
jgi:hypothetical protein